MFRALSQFCAQLISVRRYRLLLMLLGISIITACGVDLKKPLVDLLDTSPPAGVEGVVFNASTDTAIAGATINIAGVIVTTDADGKFSFVDVQESPNIAVTAEASGYVPTTIYITTISGVTATLTLRLLPVSVTSAVDSTTGGTVSDPSSAAQLTLGANTLVDETGAPVIGSVDVSITPIDMKTSPASVPGDFRTDTGALLEGYGAAAIDARSGSGGSSLQLADGETIGLRIPYASRSSAPAPASISLLYFDETAGKWVDKAVVGALAGSAPNQYYQASVTDIGVWMAAQSIAPTVKLNGCVKNGSSTGSGVANVRVQVEGIDYSGLSYGVTDGAGQFSIDVKPGAKIIVNGSYGSRLTNTRSQTIGSANTTITECLILFTQSGAPRITLTWGENPSDVDSHLFAPNGSHIYYGDDGLLSEEPFAALDVDDTDSYGPEVITLSRLMVGTYTYGVRLFAGSGTLTDSPVRVELRQGQNIRVFTPTTAMGETAADEWWTVFSFTVAADCSITVNPIQTFSPGLDSGPTSLTLPPPAAATYCSGN